MFKFAVCLLSLPLTFCGFKKCGISEHKTVHQHKSLIEKLNLIYPCHPAFLKPAVSKRKFILSCIAIQVQYLARLKPYLPNKRDAIEELNYKNLICLIEICSLRMHWYKC